MLNAVTQGFKIQDANRTDWIFFQYNIDESSYLLGKGFNATYSIGMEHNTIIFFQCLQPVRPVCCASKLFHFSPLRFYFVDRT
jgi:hypothetical protein